MKVILKEFKSLEIVFNEEGWINATRTAKAYNKRPDTFLRSKRFKEYLESVEKLRCVKITHLKKNVTGKGKEQGVYLHPYLCVEFARYLDSDFAVQMDMWFEYEFKKQLELKQRVIDNQQKFVDEKVEIRDKGKWWMND